MERLLKFFKWEHLPEGMPRFISRECSNLAEVADAELHDSAEKAAGLRKLLEAKDCFVRAALEDEGKV